MSRVVTGRTALFLQPFLTTQELMPTSTSLRFLNISHDINEGQVEWHPSSLPRLWTYHLHYFDYLRHTDMTMDRALKLIESWIESNPIGSQPGWEPFPASLRIVNWIVLMIRNETTPSSEILRSLHEQCLWLERSDERHILANHYFENLKALAFAGAYFNDSNANRWLEKAVRGLQCQLSEQTLKDGGHYERSPQYHCLMLENYLDLWNLTQSNERLFPKDLMGRLESTARQGLDWINDVCFPDGTIPLFNDSALNMAPRVVELNSYANCLFGYEFDGDTSRTQLLQKHESGLYGVRSGHDMMLMDCGNVGPAYQPGHTHCDFLSYELMLDGRRIIVDSGVYEYEPGEMRDYVRSTKAHNTIVVDDGDQSEIWAEFRVARRARKAFGSACVESDGIVRLAGQFSGFYQQPWRFSPDIVHRRDVRVNLSDGKLQAIGVVDVVRGRGSHLVASYIHLHPDLIPTRHRAGTISVVDRFGCVVIEVSFNGCGVAIEDSWFCPEFGMKLHNKAIVFTKRAILPTELSYEIRRV